MARKSKDQDNPQSEVAPAPQRGRPPFPWTKELEDYIITCVLANKSLRQIEEEGVRDWGEKNFPSTMTIKNYLGSNEDFFSRYTRAKDLAQDFMAEDIIDIIDGRHPDLPLADLEQRKASVEARKWIMGKLRRKKWGEVKLQEITGANGAPLVQPQIINTRAMSPETKMALYQALQIAAAQAEAEDAQIEEDDG